MAIEREAKTIAKKVKSLGDRLDEVDSAQAVQAVQQQRSAFPGPPGAGTVEDTYEAEAGTSGPV